jgi:hypothetical protein
MKLIDSSKSLKPLKIRIKSNTMALTNFTTFGVAVGELMYWRLKLKLKIDNNYTNIYIEL